MRFEETSREEWACDCGCQKKWLVSRGQIAFGGAATEFVAMPMVHGSSRLVWLGIGDGDGWVFTRSWLNGQDIAGAVVEPTQTPLAHLAPFSSKAPPKQPARQTVVADPERTKRVFRVHDEVLRSHQELQHVFNPGHGRDFTLKQPDCVFATPPERWSPRNSKNFSELGERKFVRALLPVPVSDGSELRVGLWVEVPSEPFEALLRVFWDDEPAYLQTNLSGTVENALSLNGQTVRGARVRLAPRTANECLFVAGADDGWLQGLMTQGVSVRAVGDLMAEMQRSTARHGATPSEPRPH